MELLERLVPLVPRPRINLVLYHGVLAPNAPWRRAVVARAEPEASTVETCSPSVPAEARGEDAKTDRARPKCRTWADLMRRAFEADVLACPNCGGRMVVLATIEDPAVIRRILTHLGLSMDRGGVAGCAGVAVGGQPLRIEGHPHAHARRTASPGCWCTGRLSPCPPRPGSRRLANAPRLDALAWA
jgi:hypothetical protein